jgi:hypothetical protein
MADYDFRSLSSNDFQNLSRDLLQAELGIRFENFAPTMDRGIDARHRGTILQAKHYATFATLLRTLRRDELPKINELQPRRYLLVTSLSLTVPAKEKLHALLTPHTKDGDIFGREDLNELLNRHGDVERQNYKLWLTSTAVLQRILHAGIWDDTALTIDRIRLKTARYVPNPSLQRARDILEEHHYCIIAGIQGIGKTTLAEILMLDYLDQGYDVFRIDALSEIKPVRNPDRKQFFYFDDFLGTTTLDRLERTEPQRLTEFMDDAKRNPNWRFVMTTREYILNKAQLRHEILANRKLELQKCVVALHDYTRYLRAEILYNHLYFSDITDKHKHALLEGQAYRRIIAHKNYSPRIIEHITKRDIAAAQPAEHYERYVQSVLENPQLLWAHAFDHQLTDAARNLLLVLMTLPHETALPDVRAAFEPFHHAMHERLKFTLTNTDVRDALRELDGNFITIDRWGTDDTIKFHNPSVQDFLEHRLTNETEIVRTLIDSSVYFEQLVHLWEREAEFAAPSLTDNAATIGSAIQRLLESATCASHRHSRNGQPDGLLRTHQSIERRIRFARDVTRTGLPAYRDTVPALLARLQERLRDGHSDREQLAELLAELHADEMHTAERDRILRLATPLLTDTFTSLEECEALTSIISLFPDVLTEEERRLAQEHFLNYLSEAINELHGERDVDTLRETGERLDDAGRALGLRVTDRVSDLWEAADQIEAERKEERDNDDDAPFEHRKVAIVELDDDTRIDRLFGSLREELRATTP